MERIEHDTLGEIRVPEDSLYGAQTARAVENFPISGRPLPRALLRAMARIKGAAAHVNGRRGDLLPTLAVTIERAAAEVEEGHHDRHFPVDIFQTGSGTSTNMNVNEVIGHLARAHPNDEVNLGQSSNDVFPAAIHLAAAEAVAQHLLPPMEGLRDSLARKAAEFADVLK